MTYYHLEAMIKNWKHLLGRGLGRGLVRHEAMIKNWKILGILQGLVVVLIRYEAMIKNWKILLKLVDKKRGFRRKQWSKIES